MFRSPFNSRLCDSIQLSHIAEEHFNRQLSGFRKLAGRNDFQRGGLSSAAGNARNLSTQS
jgi:hypothetical protein